MQQLTHNSQEFWAALLKIWCALSYSHVKALCFWIPSNNFYTIINLCKYNVNLLSETQCLILSKCWLCKCSSTIAAFTDAAQTNVWLLHQAAQVLEKKLNSLIQRAKQHSPLLNDMCQLLQFKCFLTESCHVGPQLSHMKPLSFSLKCGSAYLP